MAIAWHCYALQASLVNTGPVPIRLTGATFAPSARGEVSPLEAFPLVTAGPPVLLQSGLLPGAARWGRRPLAGTSLQPGESVLVQLRLRFHGCRTAATRGALVVQSTYVVHFALLGAARTATLATGEPVVMQETAPCR